MIDGEIKSQKSQTCDQNQRDFPWYSLSAAIVVMILISLGGIMYVSNHERQQLMSLAPWLQFAANMQELGIKTCGGYMPLSVSINPEQTQVLCRDQSVHTLKEDASKISVPASAMKWCHRLGKYATASVVLKFGSGETGPFNQLWLQCVQVNTDQGMTRYFLLSF